MLYSLHGILASFVHSKDKMVVSVVTSFRYEFDHSSKAQNAAIATKARAKPTKIHSCRVKLCISSSLW